MIKKVSRFKIHRSLVGMLINAFVTLSGLVFAQSMKAQVIDLGLYSTVLPDSFEVRAFSTGSQFTGAVSSMTMTVRWESSTGGVMNGQDVSSTCLGEALSFGVVQDVQGYRYFNMNLFSIRALDEAQCAIDSEGTVLFGFRIRELTSCGHVSIVNNSYTDLNNSSYYMSIDGWDVTGAIITNPISIGSCPPCEPPIITQASAASVPYCGEGIDLAVEASGTLPDYTWYRPDGTLLSWLPQVSNQYGLPGQYTVVVSNACGADTAQVEAVMDSSLCVPLLIDSAWFGPWSWGIYSGIQFHVASTGSCPQYEWTMPWGATLPTDVLHQLNVPNPTEGNYTLVASNACSSDTLVLYVVPPEPCARPLLGNASITAGNLCQTGPAIFNVSVSGPGPITTRWYGPAGQLITGSPSFALPYTPWGTYTITASNYCGSDTVTVFHGPADTTGLAACQPPQISISSAAVACFGDTIDITASVALTGPCPTLEWSNVLILSSSGNTYHAVLTSDSPVLLTATNGCGQMVVQAPVDALYPLMLDQNLCRVTGPLSLDSLLDAWYNVEYQPVPGAVWHLAGVPHNSYYNPAVDTSGIYQLYMDTAGLFCSVVDFGLHEFRGVNAGEDSSITVCSSDPPFALFNMLGGQPETGGWWRFNNLPASSTFNPAVNTPGAYRYMLQAMGMGGGCFDDAYVTIAVDSASTWYADADGDGLGDSADTLLACTQPTGYVATGDDGCPGIFGTVGDPCDDHNPQTINDTLGADCVCAGVSGIGIAEINQGILGVWPNPNGGDHFYLQTPVGTGNVQLEVTDATGRVVFHASIEASIAPALVDLPAGLVAGNYFVSVVTERTVAVRPLVVVR